MEIGASDLSKIKDMVSTMLKGPDVELEATFGRGGSVDVETFLRVAKRLSSLGYAVIPQTDKLNILLRDQVRLTLDNPGVIQQYCRDNRAFSKPLRAIKKDRSPGVVVTHILTEYDVMIKTRRELPLSYNEDRMEDCDRTLQLAFAQWDNQPKAFRMIKRWTFEKDGVRFDLSMIRSTSKDREGHYKWVKKFHDEDIMSNEPTYEMEVELLRDYFMAIDDKKAREESALKRLSGGIGVILRGIQNSTLLIKKSEERAALNAYISLVGSDAFRGVKPVTLSKENMAQNEDDTIESIRTNYNVTDKADGLRVHGFVDKNGELFMIDMNMHFYKTGYVLKDLALTLVDGEWVTLGKETADPLSGVVVREGLNNLYVFDVYYFKGADVSQKPFWSADKSVKTRYRDMEEWAQGIKGGLKKPGTGLVINNKRFYFDGVSTGSASTIFKKAADILDAEETRIYETDGLIFTSNDTPLPVKSGDIFFQQFKWKPARENTIDFMVKFERDNDGAEKIEVGIDQDSGATYRYKTARLYVGGRGENVWDDPRSTILNVLDIPAENDRSVKPVLFTPADYSDVYANVCHLIVEKDEDTGQEFVKTVDSEEPIRDLSIVEMSYEPAKSQGWRWKPLVTRPDKTAKLLRGIVQGTMNTMRNGNIIWNSIHDPVTAHMIRTGEDQPSAEELKELTHLAAATALKKTYYERKADQEDLDLVRGLRDYHKDYIKRRILYSVLKKKSDDELKYVLDTSVGRAADIHNWLRNKVDFVLGVDYAGENITEPEHGAYARYMSVISRTRDKKAVIPPMVFAIGDSSKSLVDGAAGQSPEEADMLRAVFGLNQPVGALPPFFEKKGLYGKLRDGAHVVSAMFSLHYFFETAEKFKGFLKNLDDTLRVGGYFIGACFDGRAIMKDTEFSAKKVGEKIVGIENDVELWSIVKSYSNTDINSKKNAAVFFGNAIDVNFISIGTSHREFLVPFEFLTAMLKEKGIELLTEAECRDIGVPASTQLFGDTYEVAEKDGRNYRMSDAEKRFSFLNRWFIFKRRSHPTLGETEAAVKQAARRAAPRDCRVGFKISAKSTNADAVWLDYTTHFPIPDEAEPSIVYPSVKHYMLGMLMKEASNKPEAAGDFTVKGGIHQKYVALAELDKAAGKLTEARRAELTAEENKDLNERAKKTYLKKAGIVIDDAAWVSIKDDALKHGLRVRYERDARFRTIVDGLAAQGKMLVYEAESKSSDLGGICRADGSVEGENKYGKFLMELAGF